MTAILLLVLLLAGTSAYIKWAAYWVEQGASAWWFVAGAPFAYLAPVVVLVTSWFVLSWIWRTPRPPNAQLDFAGGVRLFIGEVLAVAISWPLMALHRLLIRDPLPASGQLPVILVHGVLVNDGVWFVMRSYLALHDVGCLAQMRPGNAWLAELNRDETKPPPVPITSIWSRHDSLVAPQASGELACAENVALIGVGHNALLGDRRVMDLVIRAVA